MRRDVTGPPLDSHKRQENKRAAHYTEPTKEKSYDGTDLMTRSVIELGETPPNPPAAKNEQTRGERYFYLGTQAALVVITGVGIAIAICTLRSLNESVKASNAQASAAATQAAIADEAMRVGNRPYVQVSKSLSSKQSWEWTLDKKGNRIGVQLYLENAGNTPAERTEVCGQISNIGPWRTACNHLEPHPKPVEIPLYHQARKSMVGYSYTMGTVIPAHETIVIPVPNVTPEGIKKALAVKTGPFTVIGSFEYMNVFNEYCCEPFLISLENGKFVEEPFGTRLVLCPQERPNVCKPKSEEYPAQK
jgi:hypothetical protein